SPYLTVRQKQIYYFLDLKVLGKVKSNKIIRRMVKARMEKTLKRKLQEQNRRAHADQKELREFVLTRKDKPQVERVKPDEIISLMEDYNSPYLSMKGIMMWRGLERSWLGYKIGKVVGESGDVFEKERQKEYALKVQELQRLLRVDVDEFECLKDSN